MAPTHPHSPPGGHISRPNPPPTPSHPLQTKSNADEHQWVWESAAGAHSYTVGEDSQGDLARGTRVTLHLKPDAEELADPAKLQV